MATCASCGKTFDELRYQVVIFGIHGSFDSSDCAQKEWLRLQSRRRLFAALGEQEATRLLAETAAPVRSQQDPPPDLPAAAFV